LRFYIPPDTKEVISEMLFQANFLASSEKTKTRKPEEITGKIHSKPRLTEHN